MRQPLIISNPIPVAALKDLSSSLSCLCEASRSTWATIEHRPGCFIKELPDLSKAPSGAPHIQIPVHHSGARPLHLAPRYYRSRDMSRSNASMSESATETFRFLSVSRGITIIVMMKQRTTTSSTDTRFLFEPQRFRAYLTW